MAPKLPRIFSLLNKTNLSILTTKQPPEATAGRRQTKNEHKRALCPLIFPKSKIQQATRRRHHIHTEHLSSPNRPIENKEK